MTDHRKYPPYKERKRYQQQHDERHVYYIHAGSATLLTNGYLLYSGQVGRIWRKGTI
jgi:hypothetical protein